MSTQETTTCAFAIPVVLQNLPPAETMNQVIDNLNYLCNCFDSAFNVISNQITFQRNKIHSISKRVSKSAIKTQLISKYPNKSTTVYSHCEFPSLIISNDELLTKATEDVQNIHRSHYKLTNNQRLDRPPNCDTLQLFHRISQNTNKHKIEQPIGLGRLPSWLHSVNDCLLFNTDENPYLKYEQTNVLEGVQGIDRATEKRRMIPAPPTIHDKTRLLDQETYGLAYQPELEDVPKFHIPTTLQGLGDGIALDIVWAGHKKQAQKIAPSGIVFSALPQLDSIMSDNKFYDFDSFETGGNDDESIIPPKPPTPPLKAVSLSKIEQKNTVNERQSAPPPKPKKKAVGGRANLLDAIRAGRSLAKAGERKIVQKPQLPRTLSLMDHLKAKLKARNNIMRGKAHSMADVNYRAGPVRQQSRISVPVIDENVVLEEKQEILDGVFPSPADNLAKLNEDLKVADETGLTLIKIPKSMRLSMMLDLDNLSSGSNDWTE